MPSDALANHVTAWQSSIKEGLEFALDGGLFGNESEKNGTKPISISSSDDKNAVGKINNNVKRILTAIPSELNEIKNEIGVITKEKPECYRILSYIFDYKSFSEAKSFTWNEKNKRCTRKFNDSNLWGAYEYTKKLKVNCCPYCNRQYTLSLKVERTGKKVRPELDHFFCESRYPYLAISLYNLIPSCTICNCRLKGDEAFEHGENLHPFEDSFHDLMKFKLSDKDAAGFLNGQMDTLNVKLTKNGNQGKHIAAHENAQIFALDILYNEHKDYIAEILLKTQAYNNDWLATLKNALNGKTILDDVSLKGIYMGNYLRAEDINKRPLSKLTIDICTDLNLVDRACPQKAYF